MNGKGAWSKDRRLWQRWRALAGAQRAVEPDALLFAAYAEGRLSESEAEPIEAWLAQSPEALDDMIAARDFEQRSPRLTFERVMHSACDLVPGTITAEPATATILPLRPRLAPRWRNAIAWSSIAASLVCASLVGFSMGSDAYANLSGTTQTVDTASADVLDASPNLDSYFSDDSGT